MDWKSTRPGGSRAGRRYDVDDAGRTQIQQVALAHSAPPFAGYCPQVHKAVKIC
jgi:hypothetical protein